MKLFPEIEIPTLICRFENYTQSSNTLMLIIYILSFIGLGFLLIKFYKYVRK